MVLGEQFFPPGDTRRLLGTSVVFTLEERLASGVGGARDAARHPAVSRKPPKENEEARMSAVPRGRGL